VYQRLKPNNGKISEIIIFRSPSIQAIFSEATGVEAKKNGREPKIKPPNQIKLVRMSDTHDTSVLLPHVFQDF